MVTFLGLLALSALRAEPLDADPEDFAPGLIARYRSLRDADAALLRIDAKPAFALGGSSVHPRLPAGPFEATWTGAILLRDNGSVAFRAFVAGNLTLEIDGVAVLQGVGKSDAAAIAGSATLDRKPGWYPVKLTYRSLPDIPARLQLWWQGDAFAGEPIPPWRFAHLLSTVPPELRAETLAAEGRTLAERNGCARCHAERFPAIAEGPPGPSLRDARGRFDRSWLFRWLGDPKRVHGDSRMPMVFADDGAGQAESWIVASYLSKAASPAAKEIGNHRVGQRLFLSVGCVACHFVPEQDASKQDDLGRIRLRGLGDRFPPEALAQHLFDPSVRYGDGRMPKLPLTPAQANDVAAYLLLWSPRTDAAATEAPAAATLEAVRRRLGAADDAEAGKLLLVEKRCVQCHDGLAEAKTVSVPLPSGSARGCLGDATLPRFALEAGQRDALRAYLAVADREKHPSPFAQRQRTLERVGCLRCHAADRDQPSILETASSRLGGSLLENVPFQRTPRLTFAHRKFERSHLEKTLRDGIAGLRSDRYTFRMPSFGHQAELLAQALAERDGDLLAGDERTTPPADPTAASLAGPVLAGFQGYGCVSCHVWKGQRLAETDPANLGPDLTRVQGRIRRPWFDAFLQDPSRFHPRTPMPAIFGKNGPALLASVLEGDPAKQKDALWHYFAMGPDAPSPKPPAPLPVAVPEGGPLVAQIPLRLPKGGLIESVTMLTERRDLVVYDLGAGAIQRVFVGGQVLRQAQGRLRTFAADGVPVPLPDEKAANWRLVGKGAPEAPSSRTFEGYDRLTDGVRLRWRLKFPSAEVELAESLQIAEGARRLTYVAALRGVPADAFFECRALGQDLRGREAASAGLPLPADRAAKAPEVALRIDPQPPEGSLERPGYRAVAFPRPKLPTGEDRIMPVALAVHPRDGRLFVGSMKLGELFVVNDPARGKEAVFDDFAGGLFQEAYSLLAEDDALYVLHRRNLSRLPMSGSHAGRRVDRVAPLPHGVGETYDYGYGLAKNRDGEFVLSFAPYAHRDIPGSGGAVALRPGSPLREVAYGMRNPVGWCAGPDGDIFFTDNQGEWVATNKLVHAAQGRYFGFPNPGQKHHADKPPGKTSVWVPYGWARSINGLAYDDTQGKFGPFAGQIFLAELMYGGAIVRADLEKVDGAYQGVCFPFWGKGLLGPVSLAFDRTRGTLYVGGITEPGWMAQPDRGALFRIDYTGELPFEMRTIRVRPRGFRIHFTTPIDSASAKALASYRIEYYRYETTGAYGSPELDRTTATIEKAEVGADGRSVELTTAPLVRDRVYMIDAAGVRDRRGRTLVQPVGAYTLNAIPGE